MALELPDRWLWDSWYAHDGERWHGFFLTADRSLPNPEDRHWNVTIGHAVSDDLRVWEYLGECFRPASEPAQDDCTTWTGSVIRGTDGLWHLFYTGTSKAEGGMLQRIFRATSTDLHNWERQGLVLDLDPAVYEEFAEGRWHDRAFRDPHVIEDPTGPGYRMLFTARDAGVEPLLSGGCVGFAVSDDLETWTSKPPIFTGGYGHLEVPQLFRLGETWYCLFSTSHDFWSEEAKAIAGGPPVTGAHVLTADDPNGPWRIQPGPFLLGNQEKPTLYSPRLLETDDGPVLLAFEWFGPSDDVFRGRLTDPIPLNQEADGRLTAVVPAEWSEPEFALGD